MLPLPDTLSASSPQCGWKERDSSHISSSVTSCCPLPGPPSSSELQVSSSALPQHSVHPSSPGHTVQSLHVSVTTPTVTEDTVSRAPRTSWIFPATLHHFHQRAPDRMAKRTFSSSEEHGARLPGFAAWFCHVSGLVGYITSPSGPPFFSSEIWDDNPTHLISTIKTAINHPRKWRSPRLRRRFSELMI